MLAKTNIKQLRSGWKMTSKEALNDLIDEIKYTHNNGKTLTEYDQKRIDIIAKDLEILEIFKKHTKINALGDIVVDILFSNINYKGWEENNKEYAKIKEWLENK